MLPSIKKFNPINVTFTYMGTILILLFLFSSGALAQNSKQQNKLVSGQLVDSLGRPIQGASIFTGGNMAIEKTDAKGKFSVIYPLDRKIRCEHQAYMPLVINLNNHRIKESNVWTMQGKANFLNTITVTASTLPKEIRKISSSVSILQKGAPELQQIQTIDEALSYIPGVLVNRGKGLSTTGTHTGVILRGTGAANRTLILKDGVPINDSYTGGVSEWNSVATNGIERIEVVRGPGSSIYGSSSMGGTINLVTQKPNDKWTLGTDLRYGSYETFQGSLKIGKRFNNNLGFMAIAEYKTTGGYQFIADSIWMDHYKKPKSSLFNMNTKVSYDFNSAGTLTATADLNLQEPISGTSTIFDESSTSGNYQIRYTNNKAPFVHDIVAYYNIQNRSTSSLAWNPNDSEFNDLKYISSIPLDTYGLIAKLSRSFANHDISIGADLRFTEVISKKNYQANGTQNFSGRQDFISFFVNDDVRFFDNLHANLGLRFDHWANRNGYFFDSLSKSITEINYDDAESNILTPKVGLTYQVTDFLRLRSVYATGFRAPASFYMFNATPIGSSFRLGNPELKPEKMRYSVDLGADMQLFKRLDISATAYMSQYSDFLAAVMIDKSEVPSYFDPGNLPVRQYRNIGKVQLWGIEGSSKYQINSRISTQVSYFLNQSKILKYETNPEYEGNEMGDNPRNIYSAALIYDNPRIVHASLWGRFTGEFFGDLENSNEKQMPAVSLIDFKLAKSFGPYAVNFTVNNLFDKQYFGSYTSPTSYYYAPGRIIMLGINYNLK